jgi:hypothetical protein
VCASKRPGGSVPKDADRLIELSETPTGRADKAGRPLVTALQERRPVHARRWLLRRSDRLRMHVELTAFPLIDQAQRLRSRIRRRAGPGHLALWR